MGRSLLNFTKGKLKLVQSTQPLIFIQGATDYIRNILEVIRDKYCWLIRAGIVEDIGRSVNPNEVRYFGDIYWKEIPHNKFLGATTGKWMFDCIKNMILTEVMTLNKNVKRSLIDILSDMKSGEVVDPMAKQVKSH